MSTPPTSEMSIYQHLHQADKTTVARIVEAANASQPIPKLPRTMASERVAAAVQLRFAGWTVPAIQAFTGLNGSRLRLVCAHVHEHTKPVSCYECGQRPRRIAGLCTFCYIAAERRGET